MSARSLATAAVLLCGEALWSQVPALRSWTPHLGLVWIVFAASWVELGPLLGAAAAIGFIEDALFGTPFGLNPLGLIVMGAASHRARHHFFPEHRLNVAVFMFLYAVGEMALLGGVLGGPKGVWFGVNWSAAVATAVVGALAPRWVDRGFPRPPVHAPAIARAELK
ncbi:MAG: hypothetical protein Kow0059_19340 [Candidatus Sumerlaeia bacterium]